MALHVARNNRQEGVTLAAAIFGRPLDQQTIIAVEIKINDDLRQILQPVSVTKRHRERHEFARVQPSRRRNGPECRSIVAYHRRRVLIDLNDGHWHRAVARIQQHVACLVGDVIPERVPAAQRSP